MKRGAVLALLMLAACAPQKPAPAKPPVPPPTDKPNKAGLVPLPCARDGAVRPIARMYCTGLRHYMTPAARRVVHDAAAAMARKYPGTPVAYMEASWPIGRKPMPPHLSHGDGRQLDVALYYQTLDGKPLGSPRILWNGFDAYEPPRREAERTRCPKGSAHEAGKDPPKTRKWRLDEARTRDLISLFANDPRVRRVFIEPHLKARLGFAANSKVRFAGCSAARHDDHLHVDFY